VGKSEENHIQFVETAVSLGDDSMSQIFIILLRHQTALILCWNSPAKIGRVSASLVTPIPFEAGTSHIKIYIFTTTLTLLVFI